MKNLKIATNIFLLCISCALFAQNTGSGTLENYGINCDSSNPGYECEVRDSPPDFIITATEDGDLTINVSISDGAYSCCGDPYSGGIIAKFTHVNSVTGSIHTFTRNASSTYTHPCVAEGEQFHIRYSGSKGTFSHSASSNAPLYANDIEPNDNESEAINLSLGTIMEGHLSYGTTNDYDYYRLVMPEDGDLKVTGNIVGACFFSLYANSGGELGTGLAYEVSSASDTLVLNGNCFSKNDTFYVSIAANGSNCTNYQIFYEVNDIPTTYDNEPNNTPDKAINLNLGEIKTGNIGYGYSPNVDAYDYYRLVMPQSGDLRISATFEGTGRIDLKRKNDYSIDIQHASTPNTSETLEFELDCVAKNDTFLVKIQKIGDCSSYELFYELESVVGYSNEIEPNDTRENAQDLTGSQSAVYGNVGHGYYDEDNDYFDIGYLAEGEEVNLAFISSENFKVYVYKGVTSTYVYKSFDVLAGNWDTTFAAHSILSDNYFVRLSRYGSGTCADYNMTVTGGCSDILEYNNAVINGNNHQAQISIEADNCSINPNATFNAPDVKLLNDFIVPDGNEFCIESDGCP